MFGARKIPAVTPAATRPALAPAAQPTCDCCGKPSSSPLIYDMDRRTGQARGRLCEQCDFWVDSVRRYSAEGIVILRRALAYLDTHNK